LHVNGRANRIRGAQVLGRILLPVLRLIGAPNGQSALMNVVLWVVVGWFVASIAMALAVGPLLRGARHAAAAHVPTMLDADGAVGVRTDASATRTRPLGDLRRVGTSVAANRSVAGRRRPAPVVRVRRVAHPH
jgi:hypothetical protein